MDEETRPPERVVFAPDIMVCCFEDAEYLRLLQFWRDGSVKPLVTTDLLKRYLRILNALGIPSRILKSWIVWFKTEDKSQFLEGEGGGSGRDICIRAARAGGAEFIVTRKKEWLNEPLEAGSDKIQFISASDFLKQYERRALQT